MRKSIRLVGYSIAVPVAIACARSGFDSSEEAHPSSGGSMGIGGNSLSGGSKNASTVVNGGQTSSTPLAAKGGDRSHGAIGGARSSSQVATNSVMCPPGYAGPECETPVIITLEVPANLTSCRVRRISGDCSTAVGTCKLGESYRAMKWDTATGKATVLPSPARANASGTNNDGSLIVGTISPDESASSSSGVVWRSPADEPTAIDQATSINAVSDDGRIAIGKTSVGVAYWDISNLFTSGATPNPIIATKKTNWETSLVDVSSDGSSIVGTLRMIPRGRATNEAAIRWTEATGVVPIIPTPDGDPTNTSVASSEVLGVSGDGKVTFGVLIGWIEDTPVRWRGTGEREQLPPEGAVDSIPIDSNFDGSIVVGSKTGNAVLWDTNRDIYAIETLLAGIDINFPPQPDYSSMSSFAEGICNDGTVIVGNFQDGANGNAPIPWVIHLKGTGILGL